MPPVLTVEKVGYSYPQDHRGIAPVTFSLIRGDCLFISGASGSGKSTLARCLAGLIPHLYHGQMTGEVRVHDRWTSSMQMWEISEQIGLVFQNPALQMLTASVEDEILFGLENLGLSREEMHKRLEFALESFDLTRFRKRNPLTLSGGEQQKLTLAAALSRSPSVLILDEPLSMLDSTSSFEFIRLLQHSIDEGVAAVIFEHRHHYVDSIQPLRRIDLDISHETISCSEVSEYPLSRKPFELFIRNLSVQRGKKRILNDLSLELTSGQIVAVVGRNGTGKTTLLRTLAGLQPFEGSIQCSDSAECAQFNMVFQNPDTQLFNPSVKQEVQYKVQAMNTTLYEWVINALDLKRYEDTQPLLLSEGEKRRVALATAILHPHKHGVLLDEPSLGQDQAHKTLLLRLLRTLAAAGWMILFTTHDLELASQADRLILLTENGIAADGAVKEIMQNKEAWNTAGLVLPEWICA